MFKAYPLLLVGIALSMWGRSMTHDDRLSLGLKEAGQVQIRSTAGSVSLSANPGLVKLGKEFGFETSFVKKQPPEGEHSGFGFAFTKPMQWEVRAPWWGLAIFFGFWLFVRARMTRE